MGPDHRSFSAARTFADVTTMRVGGPAARWVEARTREDIASTYGELLETEEPHVILAGGSNTVAASDPFAGAVLHVQTRGVIEEAADDSVLIHAEAGENWDALVERTVTQGLTGLEALSGVPGSVGAAPVQNIGAYGAELAQTLQWVDLLDAETLEVRRVPASELRLGYRDSALKRGELRGVVLGVALRLNKTAGGLGGPVAYGQLAQALGVELGERVPVAEVRQAVVALRTAKGMVLSDDLDSVSAGSFFTNPIVSTRFAGSLPSDVPQWPVAAVGSDALVKLSAAWLIEQSGLPRGFALPHSQAAISTKHTLAITNRGGATGEQVAELARFVQARVENQFGVRLIAEPVLVGLSL